MIGRGYRVKRGSWLGLAGDLLPASGARWVFPVLLAGIVFCGVWLGTPGPARADEEKAREVAPVDTAGLAGEITIKNGEIAIKKRGGETERIRFEEDTDRVEGMVKLGRRIVVGPDETVVGDVVAIGSSVLVKGKVLGDAVAIGGSVRVEGDGVIDGDAVSLGGEVTRDRTARINGETISLGFLPESWPSRRGGELIGPWNVKLLLKLGQVAVLALLTWLSLQVAPARMAVLSSAVERSFFLSLLIGFGIVLASIPLVALLVVTVVGIPLAILYPVLFLVASVVAYAAVVTSIGRRVGGSSPSVRRSPAVASMLGIAVVEGIGVLGVLTAGAGGVTYSFGLLFMALGCALGMVIVMVGLGAEVLTWFGSRPYPRAE